MGQVAEFAASEPFVVRSQEEDHPFYMASYMSGCSGVLSYVNGISNCPGDPEMVGVIAANDTLCGWLRYPREELVGQLRFQELLTMGGRIFWQTHLQPLLHIQASVAEYNDLYAHPFEWTWTNHKMRQWFAKHAA